MRSLVVVALWSTAALAQQYVISTYAGGALPATPTTAVAGSIGAPISVATDALGNVYFASPDLNCVFKLDPAGKLTRIAGNGTLGYSGDGGPAAEAQLQLRFGNSSANSAGLAVDSAGNLFIADTNNHRIRRVTPDGVITTVAGTGKQGFSGDGGPAVDAQLNWPWGVAVNNAGDLFIVDALNYRVRKVASSGIISTVAGGGTQRRAPADGELATDAQLSPWAVAADDAGNLFIMVQGFTPSDSGRSIRKVSPNGVITTVARVNAWNVAVDGAGNLIVSEASGRVSKVSNGSITTVAGNGTVGFSGDGGPATNAQLNYPWGVAVDGAGNLFIADRLNFRIRKVTPGGAISTVAGDGSGGGVWANGGPATDGGPATSSQLSDPQGVAVDRAGNLFIADSGNRRIRKVSPGGIITTVAGTGAFGYSGDGGQATGAQLGVPIAVAVDGAGNLFVADAGNNSVRKVSISGIITTVAGNGTYGSSGDGGPATAAALGFNCNRACGGVAVDLAGNLFISHEERIRKVSPDGIIRTVAGGGTSQSSSLDGGLATEGQVYPLGITVDGSGNLYFGEYNGVRKVSTSGIITTVAGRGTIAGSAADGGLATKAHLSFPYAVVVDAEGNLFIADPGAEYFTGGELGPNASDHRIRRVSPDGIITTVSGNGRAGFSGDGGPAFTATLNGPMGLAQALDGSGNLYVSESGNHRVRLLRLTNQPVLIGAVVDAASQRSDAIAPGKIVVIYGAGLGPSALIQNQPDNGQLSKALSGTVVSFNGVAAPMLYTSATQVAEIVPYTLTGTPVQVTVTYQGQVSTAYTIPVAASAPGLFTVNQSGWGQAAAINAVDGTVNSPTNPVRIGAYISLYATGEGQTSPAGVDGRIAGSTSVGPALSVTVTVGGVPATVQYAGSVSGQVAGLMQVNVQIPSGVQPGGYVPLVLQVGNASTTASAVWIAVSRN